MCSIENFPECRTIRCHMPLLYWLQTVPNSGVFYLGKQLKFSKSGDRTQVPFSCSCVFLPVHCLFLFFSQDPYNNYMNKTLEDCEKYQSTSLVLCEKNPMMTSGFPSKGSIMQGVLSCDDAIHQLLSFSCVSLLSIANPWSWVTTPPAWNQRTPARRRL